MDPVTILSVAAASFQFAELAVRSFSKIAKITKDFEDVPKRMRDQLNDIKTSITRLRDFSTDLTRDAAVSSLEPSRLGSLTSAVNNWLTTAADLESTLQGILSPLKASKRRKWQIAFKSLRQADDIEWQIQKLQSLNHEIWAELLRTLLASQLKIKSDIIDGGTKISSSLQVAFQKLQDEQSNSKSHIVAIVEQEGINTRATLDNLTTSMNASFDQHSLQASRGQEAMVSRINAHVSEELQILRAFVSSATREGNASLDYGPETTNMSQGLVRGGSVLTARDSGLEVLSRGNPAAAPDPFIPVHQRSRHENQSPPPCRCSLRIKRVWQVSKGLRLRYEAVKHVFPCPHSMEMQQFRSVSIHIELPRFMGPAIEMSVATATVRTGYAFSQTFRCFPTVERLTSPIFGEFDALQSFFHEGDSLWPVPSGQIDIDAVRCMIRDLPRRLQRITATGAGSCRDKDEEGNTLLLETVYLTLRLKHRLSEVSVELIQLLDFLRTVGLDISGTGIQRLRSPGFPDAPGIMGYTSTFPHIGSIDSLYPDRRATAQSLAMVFAQEAPESFSIHSYFKGFELEDYCSLDSSFPMSIEYSAYGRACQRQRATLFSRLNPGLVFEVGGLEGAITHRDMVKLKSILRKPNFDPREYNWTLILANLELSAFQLAMDWKAGIVELLSKFSPTTEDIEFAIHIDTPLSLEILRILWPRISGALDDASIFHILLRTSDRAVTQVIELTQESHLKLYQFAMASLNDEERERFCLTSDREADWKVSEVWAALIRQGCGVPLRYKPMRSDFLFSLLGSSRAVDYFMQGSPGDGETTRSASELLQRYCDLGFLEVNCQRFWTEKVQLDETKAVETPFVAFLKSFDICDGYKYGAWFPIFAEICLWFLSNGASPNNFDGPRPNLLFFLARFLTWDSWHLDGHGNEPGWHRDIYSQPKLWETALERCSAEQSDACQCFCTVAGCLPTRDFLQPPGSGFDQFRAPRAVLDKRLLLWFEVCPLSEEQKARCVEDAIRLETFHRLGMTHTCCAPAKELYWNTIRYQPLGSDDVEEIRTEESELKGHLDLIMQAYRTFSREIEDWDAGLSKWWIILEGILPHLSDLNRPLRQDFGSKEEYEHAVYEMEQDRAELEAQTLQSNGYGGMDFADVIKLHLCEYLQDWHVGAAE